MEDLRTIYQQLLRSDGIGQDQRLLTALEEEYVQLEDRSIARQINVLYRLSKELVFFNNDFVESSNWSALFKRFRNSQPLPELVTDEEIENDIARIKNFDPALGLLIVFLKLSEHLKASLNRVTRRHLEFYYKEILGFRLHPGGPDKLHVLFELSRNAAPLLIAAGTTLDAGKTKDGKELRYKTTSDIVVNQARIADIRSLFAERFNDRTVQLWSATYDPLQMPGIVFPFGSPQAKLPASAQTMRYVATGLFIASSLLELEGGERRITLTVISEIYEPTDEAPVIDIDNYLRIALTGEKGWVAPLMEAMKMEWKSVDDPADPTNPIKKKKCELTITLLLTEGHPPITGHVSEVHKTSLADGIPVLGMTTIADRKTPEFLQKFRIASVHIRVTVKGLKKLIVQNEEGVQAADSPFLLFSSSPAIGDHLYIGSRECFHKNLTSLTINLQWKSPPADFVKHYAGYRPPSTFSPAVFQASLDMLLDGTWAGHPLKEHFLLFNAQQEGYPLTINIPQSSLDKANNLQPLPRGVNVPDLSGGFQSGMQRGFVRLTLTAPVFDNFVAFGHSNFANALTVATLEMVQFPGAGVELPLPPYTPQVKDIAVDYEAADTVFPGNNDGLYHQTAFGTLLLNGKGATLLPAYPDTGYLYIGIADLQPAQQVSLLFALAEKSSAVFEGYDSVLPAPLITWSYLVNDTWAELRQDQVPADTTRQLQQPGIVTIVTGTDAGLEHRSMPGGMIWLQAALSQGLNKVPPLSAIHTQAVEAVLDILPGQQPKDFADHLAAGLLPDQIKKNVQLSPSLKAIRQPYASFGGAQPESSGHFITRVSERLRHRKRVVHTWDVERLGLEAFPGIAKIKCLAGDEQSVAGTARVVIIPRINEAQPLAKRLQPRAGSFFLEQVREFVSGRSSFFTNVVVTNPDYEEVLTDFKVKFRTGFDPVFYLAKLNEDIVRFLSPWAFDEKTALHFDAEIYRSEIMYFIEKLPYVDYIADFKLFHLSSAGVQFPDVIGKMKIGKTFVVHKPPVPNIGGMKIGESFIVGLDWEVISPSRNSAILVSVPQHTIKMTDDQRICSGISGLGIGTMTIKLDFIVSSS